MTASSGGRPGPGGAIAWMATNSVAANLLMLVVIFGGVLGVARIKQEVFPEFTIDTVNVTVVYPGASPEEVEQGIVLAIEEEVRGLEGVKRLTSVAAEGAGNVSVEALLGFDADRLLADVKSAVDAIQSFPEDAERPIVALASRRREVISIVIAGDQEPGTLHGLAEQVRQELLDMPEITQVELKGVRPLELAVEVPVETLESLGLDPESLAEQVRSASVELPAGELETRQGKVLVRVADRRLDGAGFEEIVLRGTPDGAALSLGEIARITDGYADTDQASFYDGKPAVLVTAFRVGDETPTEVARAVRRKAETFRERLPGNITVDVLNDDSEILADRIDLLTRNAVMGLVLVVLVLAAFLEIRLAGWVALGIPVSFLGAFLLMPAMDLSINMITLFALIVTLGMVVDDAIVVGENVYEKLQRGVPRLQAAIEGAQEMAVPVTFSILTTVAAFSPLLVVPGIMGKIFRLIPAVVIAVLLVSLAEAFFVLPAHLGHGSTRPPRGLLGLISRLQRAVSGRLDSFSRTTYRHVLERSLEQRYIVLALSIAVFVLTVSGVAGGLVPFSFFPQLEGDKVTAAVRLPFGAPLERTREAVKTLEESARKVIAANGGGAILKGMFTSLGQGPQARGPGGGDRDSGSHLATVELNLVPTEKRRATAAGIAADWTRLTPPIAGLEALTFQHTAGPAAGAAVDVQLAHSSTDVLAEASTELTEVLRGYSDLTNVENAYAAGKPRLDFELLPEGRTLGLTSGSVARQLRGAIFGAEAIREQRGRNEIKVMVRLPEEQRSSERDLSRLLVRTPDGGHVPLTDVARMTRTRSPTAIRREEGKRIVDVKGELAPGVVTPRPVLEDLQDNVLPALKARYRGLDVSFVGQQREQMEAFQSLGLNYPFALFVIFALLAVPFGSYVQPLIVMTAIPFGIVGAVAGHVLMGYSLSIISVFGIIALSGVVVNDSLVLIHATNGYREEGATAREAILHGGTRRLRPILLTSLTTFFGLIPIIFETSIQARFLIPMAISLGFGVMFSTLIVLILVPALYLIVEDVVEAAGS